MKKNKINKCMVSGLLINSIKYLVDIPYALACFSTGLGISSLIFGIYVMNNDLSRIRNWKSSLLTRWIKAN